MDVKERLEKARANKIQQDISEDYRRIVVQQEVSRLSEPMHQAIFELRNLGVRFPSGASGSYPLPAPGNLWQSYTAGVGPRKSFTIRILPPEVSIQGQVEKCGYVSIQTDYRELSRTHNFTDPDDAIAFLCEIVATNEILPGSYQSQKWD